jgi:hypothetical protein
LLASDETPANSQLWYEAQKAGWSIVAFDDEAGEKERTSAAASSITASLCFAQQAVEGEMGLHPRNVELFMNRLLNASSGILSEVVPNQFAADGNNKE